MRFVILLLVGFFMNTSSMAASFETLQWQTKNGVRVVFYPAKEVPILDMSIAFAAGSAYDGSQFGLSALTTHLINQGNDGLDAGVIADQIERTGAQFSAESSRDMAVLSLKTLTNPAALNDATDAFALIINHPDFLEAAFDREKNQQLMSIKKIDESPDDVASLLFFQALYHDHPYGHPTIGDAAHVSAMKVTQVRDFYHRYFVGKNAVLVLVGAIDEGRAHQLAEKITADLPEGQEAAPLPKAQPLLKGESINKVFPSSQTVLRLGQLGITHQDPRYFPLIVGNYTLGGGSLVSDLAIELREKRGLTYGVYSQYLPMPGVGPFVINLSTRNNKATEAATLTRDTLISFAKNGPTEKQMIAAKQYLTGGFPLSLASNRNIADILLKIAFYHLPNDYLTTYLQHINAVTLDEIKAAFKTQINSDALLQVSVGKL